jgi:hypothetical protein
MSSAACFQTGGGCFDTVPRVVNFKPHADALCSGLSLTQLGGCAPDDAMTMQLCKPGARFGYYSRRLEGPTRVDFMTPCRYLPGERAVRISDTRRLLDDQVTSLDQLTEMERKHRLVGIVARGGVTGPRGTKGERVTLSSLPPQQASLVFLLADETNTCPVLGQNAPNGAEYMCGSITHSAKCSYPIGAIAGGCATKACVLSGIETFRAAVADLVSASELTPLETQFRDRGLAHLVRGLMEEGACGTSDVSCLALLDGDCASLGDAATNMQTGGRRVLYEAFKAASEKCIADAGLRERSEDQRQA